MADFKVVGQRAPKLDALDKALGRAVYAHDLRPSGMLWGKILWSEQAHARILHVDTSRARRLPGVKAVITAADCPSYRFGYGRDNMPLKGEVVRWTGDALAAVAAIDEDIAEEALELIRVEYEPLPAIFDPLLALAPDAPRIHADRPSNLFTRYNYQHGDVEAGLAQADCVVEDTFHLPYVAHSCMETSVCLASFAPDGRLTLWSTTQVPFLLQRDLAEALGLPGRDIRIIQTAVGGAFGRGLDIYPFEPIAALLARATGRPVRIAFSREEEFRAAPVRQPLRVTIRSGAKRDGTLLVRDVQAILDAGAYISWGAVTPLVMMETVGSLYRLPHARFQADVVYTNNPPTGAMRGFGNPQSTFFVEVSMEHLARELGLDPIQFRLRNANRPNETTPQGLRITSCALRECLERAWQACLKPMNAGRPRTTGGPLSSVRRGIGIAATLNVGGGARIYRSDGCGATVKVDDFGRVSVVTGATEIGQGSDVVLAQIVAEVLGVPLEDVTIVNSDTDVKPWDVGVHASRTTFIAGRAAWLAAHQARRQIIAHAAQMLGEPPENLTIAERRVFVKDQPERGVMLDKVVRALHFRSGGQVVQGQAWYDPPNEMVDKQTYKGNISAAYGFGAQAAEVEVDIETGRVRVLRLVAAHDVGRAINPMYVEGQIEGGVQMGLGYALTEELIVRQGRVLNPNFLDYRLPTALDMPQIETILIESADPEGPFGAKGVGEMGCNPTAAAIANAVYDATGVLMTRLPMTPENVLQALREASPSRSYGRKGGEGQNV